MASVSFEQYGGRERAFQVARELVHRVSDDRELIKNCYRLIDTWNERYFEVQVSGKNSCVVLADERDLESVQSITWNCDDRGYVRGTVKIQKTTQAVKFHTWVTGNLITDHRNGVRTDNRRNNLRSATPRSNSCNLPLAKRNTTGANGVTKVRSKLALRQWRFRWSDVTGARHSKSFSYHKGDHASRHRAWQRVLAFRAPIYAALDITPRGEGDLDMMHM